MRIIHCADLHLDSKLTSIMDGAKAKERRAELLATFTRMVNYAKIHDVSAILIAGDMFDTSSISATTRNTVRDTIIRNNDIDFYYLKGNHDRDSFLSSLDEVPANLKLFTNEWTSYPLNDDGSVILTALELDADNSVTCFNSLVLNPENINIVMLHGQETEGITKDKAEIVPIKELKNKSIDYLALGHIHKFKQERLDGRGVYCYSGCLEGRGFDEWGVHGFVLIDIDENAHTLHSQLVPFATRELYAGDVDVSGCLTTGDMISKISASLSMCDATSSDMVQIILTGELDIEAEKNIDYICKNFCSNYFLFRVKDETKLRIDYTEYALDASLKGEYVRMIQDAEDIPAADKPEVIKMGLMALANETV